MYDLPLFPLNTVLFPHMPLSLHIFEPRYKIMIDRCIRNQQPFGVVLIQTGKEALGPLPTPHSIGCTAQITKVDRLSGGRMNIVAIGVERFHILNVRHDMPYLVGEVESYPLEDPDVASSQQASQQLRPWVERYLTVLSKATDYADAEFDPAQLPQDPLALGYLAAALLQIPSEQKQPLLAEVEAPVLLTDIRTLYQREVALMRAIMARDSGHARSETSLFTLN
jgi:Lon protease-like protein